MNEKQRFSSYLAAASELIELTIAPEYFEDVYKEFCGTTELARELMEFELSEDVRPAPVFRP